MSHLKLETLARLVDDAAAADEAAHLEGCARCRGELEDLRADAVTLAALPPIDPPAGEWRAVEARLAAEGLVRRRSGGWRTAGLRIAAAIALFVLGTAAGAAWPGGQQPVPVATADAPARQVVETAPAIQSTPPEPAETAAPVVDNVQRTERPTPQLPVALRSNPRLAAVLDGQAPSSYEEAVEFYRETEGLYLDALTRMAELGGGGEYGDPYARLAALQAITSITRTALGQAPTDPVLNGYHVTALAQRDATLRQIAAMTTDSWF